MKTWQKVALIAAVPAGSVILLGIVLWRWVRAYEKTLE